MITPEQLKIIQTLLNKRFTDRQERLDFLSEFFAVEIKSTKDLTEKQAFQLIRYLKEGKAIDNAFFARFDSQNPQHRTLLARCHELGWVTVTQTGKALPDLNKLGGWLISKRSPVKKALLEMSHKEVSKIIFAIENMIKGKYK
ncbi:MAG: hypothetical protein Q4A00_08310 [Flavobacteriaceae bacterium]|nr:hypothetical protein [Flavobacteriaceae bacterium]